MAIDTLPTAPDLQSPDTLESLFSAWLAALGSFSTSVEAEGALITGGLPALDDFTVTQGWVPVITDRANFVIYTDLFTAVTVRYFQSIIDFSAAVPGLVYTLPAAPDISDRSTFNTRFQAWIDALKHENWPSAVEALV